MTIQQTYLELITQIRRYLLQEHDLKEWIPSDTATYHYFKDLARSNKAVPPSQKPAPLPQTNPPSPHKTAKENPKIIAPATSSPSTPEEIPARTIEKAAASTFADRISSREAADKVIVAEKTPQQKKDAPKDILKVKEFFTLEPIGPPQTADFTDLRAIITAKFPHQKILDKPLSNLDAKVIQGSSRVKPKVPPIVIFSFQEPENELLMLRNMAAAIEKNLAPVIVYDAVKLERENRVQEILNAPELRLLITSKQKHSAIFEKTLILMEPIQNYLQDQALRAALWNEIKSTWNSLCRPPS